MTIIIKYDIKIIAGVEQMLNELLYNLNHFPHNEIQKILQVCVKDLRDNKVE